MSISKITVEEHPAQPTLAIRLQTSPENLSNDTAEAINKIMAYLEEIGKEASNMPYSAYHNMESMDQQVIDVEVGIPVEEDLPGKGNIQATKLPAGKYATITFVGPYEGLPEAYERLELWEKENKVSDAGVVYEFYINDPDEVTPEELETVVALRLE
jgi:effector-binding domain-containing protein